MANNETTRVYWDSCVFLSYVNGTADRLNDINAFLERASNGEIEVLTSTISIVEVAFAKVEQDRKALDPEIDEKIATLWAPGSGVKLVEFYALIADEAKALMRSGLAKGWSLKPIDAIHLATAKRMSVPEFHTYDETLFRYAQELGFAISRPAAGQLKLL